MNYALINVINMLFRIFYILIMVDILGSWILAARVNLPNWVYSTLAAVHTIVSPILTPFRRLIPSIGGMDFSPIIALFVLQFVQRFLVGALAGGF